MSDLFVLDAEVRDDQGKGASRRLRRENKVPAILYGAGQEPMNLALSHSELIRQLGYQAFYSHILTINVNGKSHSAILKDLQRHPYKPSLLHLDFLRVTANKPIRVNVPLEFVNEATSLGVKAGGQVSHNMIDVEVECLPGDLPESIAVDLAEIDIGESFHLSSLVLPKGVTLLATVDDEHDLPVVSIHVKAAEMEEEEEGEIEAEGGEEPIEDDREET